MFGQRPRLSKDKTWDKFDKRIGGGTIPKRKVVSFHLWQKGWFGKEEEMGYADWPNPKNWQVRCRCFEMTLRGLSQHSVNYD